MIDLHINGTKIKVKPGTTVMDAAGQLGIIIPAMCHNENLPEFASCMVCVVKNKANGKIFPSCSVRAENGMDIITFDEELFEARKIALELLLSDHVGDCEAPCQLSCPAHMDIPTMNRLLAEGEFEKAYEVVIKDIALPSILGRICPAPCEGACRRKPAGGAVSICLLKRAAGDTQMDRRLQTADSGIYAPISGQRSAVRGRSVAVIGSGPHGLAAAWYLQQWGHQCTIYDRNELPGGTLRYSVPHEQLPASVLDAEIFRIRKAGVIFKMKTDINQELLEELQRTYDAVIEPVTKPLKMAIRAAAVGKEDAIRVHKELSGLPPTDDRRLFNSRFGKLQPDEIAEYLKESVQGTRIEPAGGLKDGLTREEVMAEAARCMHCDCRKVHNCKLRDYSEKYLGDQRRFLGPSRKNITKIIQHDTVVYEPQKCIKCGICVRITAEHKEELGLTYIGRGFDVIIGVPFEESLRSGLTHTALLAADSCPTGALSRKEEA